MAPASSDDDWLNWRCRRPVAGPPAADEAGRSMLDWRPRGRRHDLSWVSLTHDSSEAEAEASTRAHDEDANEALEVRSDSGAE